MTEHFAKMFGLLYFLGVHNERVLKGGCIFFLSDCELKVVVADRRQSERKLDLTHSYLKCYVMSGLVQRIIFLFKSLAFKILNKLKNF